MIVWSLAGGVTVFTVAQRVFAFRWPVTVGEGGSGLGVLGLDDPPELMSVPYFFREIGLLRKISDSSTTREGRPLIGLV